MLSEGSRLRIGVVAPPFYEVPPSGYGGTELVCAALVEALIDRGHEVTLVAAGRHRTRGDFLATFSEPQPEGTGTEVLIEVEHVARAATMLSKLNLDIVHDHTLLGPLTATARACPTVSTVHRPLSGPEAYSTSWEALAHWVYLVAVSDAQRQSAPHLPWLGTVHHGIPVHEYHFSQDKDPYVLYLGRLNINKGVHLAIDAARQADREIVIAGSWTTPSEQVYFDSLVRPKLGSGVTWLGEVGGADKKDLLAAAHCLIFPSTWREPFGLVLVEALASGTPVVALRRGAAAEIVENGRTGFVCADVSGLSAALNAAGSLDPKVCRATALERFSASTMARDYDLLYQRTLHNLP
jgi:glycosyltransferase involved in cell wall biosynthesis